MRNTHHCIINRTYNPFWVGNPKKQVLLYIFCCCHICLFNEQNIICYIAVICSSLAHHIKEQFCWPKEKRSNHISNLTLTTAIYQVKYFQGGQTNPLEWTIYSIFEHTAKRVVSNEPIKQKLQIHSSLPLHFFKGINTTSSHFFQRIRVPLNTFLKSSTLLYPRIHIYIH